jgi:hypothetical protein
MTHWLDLRQRSAPFRCCQSDQERPRYCGSALRHGTGHAEDNDGCGYESSEQHVIPLLFVADCCGWQGRLTSRSRFVTLRELSLPADASRVPGREHSGFFRKMKDRMAVPTLIWLVAANSAFAVD